MLGLLEEVTSARLKGASGMVTLQEQLWFSLKDGNVTQKEQSRRVEGKKRQYEFMSLHLIAHGGIAQEICPFSFEFMLTLDLCAVCILCQGVPQHTHRLRLQLPSVCPFWALYLLGLTLGKWAAATPVEPPTQSPAIYPPPVNLSSNSEFILCQ